jgi:hypothetical protein
MAITAQMRTEISQLYVALFGRAPDGAGLGFWVTQRDQGRSLVDIANTMFATEPARVYYPTYLSNSEIITSFYVNVLGRQPDAEGLAFWTAKMNAPGASFGAVVTEMIAVVASYSGSNVDSKNSHDLFVNKVQVAQYYAEHNGTVDGATAVLASVSKDPTSVTSLKIAIDNGVVPGVNQGSVFTLTVNQDHGAPFTGTTGNDTYNANAAQDGAGNLIQTLQDVDNIEAGDGFDVLNVTLSQPTTVAATLRHLEQVNVRFMALDATLNLVNSPEVVAAVVHDSTTSGKLTNINGLSTLTIRDQAQDVTIGGVAGSATSMALNLDNVVGATVNLGLDNASRVNTLKVATNNSRTFVDATVADTYETAEVAATGKNVLGLNDGKASVQTLKVTGTGTVDLGAGFNVIRTVDASAHSGGLMLGVASGATVSITTGSGNDVINVGGQTAAGSKVSLGAGDDVLKLGAAAAKFDGGLDGGDGRDVANIGDGATLTAALGGSLKNFEVLDIAGGTGSYDVSRTTITSFQADAALSAFTNLFAADVTLDKVSKAASFTLISHGANVDTGTKALNVNGKDWSGTTAAGTGETFTLVAQMNDGNKNNIAEGSITLNNVAANGVETVVLDASAATLDLGPVGTQASQYTFTTGVKGDVMESLVIKGNAHVSITFANSDLRALSRIDASGNQGGFSLDLSDPAYNRAVDVIGSDGADTYAASKAGGTINMGKGHDLVTLSATSAHDTIVLKAATDSQVQDLNKDGRFTLSDSDRSFDEVTNFAIADDKIDVTNFGFSGSQRGIANVSAKVGGNTDLASVAGFFSDVAGNRGVAFADAGYLFVDCNKDGNFTAADDLVIRMVGLADIANAVIF